MQTAERVTLLEHKSINKDNNNSYEISQEESKAMQVFADLLSFSQIKVILDYTTDHLQFYKLAGNIMECIPKKYRKEIYYRFKIIDYFDGVPSELIYTINQMKSIYKGIPNVLAHNIPKPIINKYSTDGALQDGVSINDVISLVIGEFRPVNQNNRIIQYEGYAEVLADEFVCVLPTDIVKTLGTIEDIKSIRLIEDKGLAVGGSLLRVVNRYGLTVNELDLRNCM